MSLVNDFSRFKHLHYHYQTWSLARSFDQAVKASSPSEALQRFWRAGIIEFHLYYLMPLLSLTRCNHQAAERISGLSWKALSPNGLDREGILTAKAGFGLGRGLLFKGACAGLRTARFAHGLRSVLAQRRGAVSLQRPPAALGIWAGSPRFVSAMSEVLAEMGHPPVVVCSHQASVGAAVKGLVKAEFVHVTGEGTFLPELGATFGVRPGEYRCEEHGVHIPSDVLTDLWRAFVSARWDAFFGFRAAAIRTLRPLRERGLRVMVWDHERNLRERAWCQVAKGLGIARVGVEPAIMGADPLRAYAHELEYHLLDSTFTAGEFEKMGHPQGTVLGKGHVGLGGLINSIPSGDARKTGREKLGLPSSGRLVLFATQDVGEVPWTRKGKANPAVEELKRAELEELARLSEKLGFTVVIKPHRAEGLEFYRSSLEGKPRFVVLGHDTSIYDLIAVSDACITRWSTAGYEAMACGIPVFYLNFYHYMPDLAAFHEPWIQVARTAEETPAKFEAFWSQAFAPGQVEKIRIWAREQGWSTEANRSVGEFLTEALRRG